MNPNWGDCGEMQNCGLAQIFDFTVSGDKIWFTEWVENNIGVVDTKTTISFSDIRTTFNLAPSSSVASTQAFKLSLLSYRNHHVLC